MQNGNFGAGGGSFTDWTISYSGGNTNIPSTSPMVFDGGSTDPAGDPFYARFLNEANGSEDILSQNIATVPGDIYLVSFYAEDGAGHNFTTDFSFGNFTDDLGPAFETSPGEFIQGFTNFTFTLSATQPETDLSFLVRADTQTEFGVTGISVMVLPEPGTLALAALGGLSLILFHRARKARMLLRSGHVERGKLSPNTRACPPQNSSLPNG